MQNKFQSMLQDFEAWCEAQESAGWESPDVKRAAEFLRLSLWTCAHNNPVPAPILAALKDYTDEFAKARAAAKP